MILRFLCLYGLWHQSWKVLGILIVLSMGNNGLIFRNTLEKIEFTNLTCWQFNYYYESIPFPDILINEFHFSKLFYYMSTTLSPQHIIAIMTHFYNGSIAKPIFIFKIIFWLIIVKLCKVLYNEDACFKAQKPPAQKKRFCTRKERIQNTINNSKLLNEFMKCAVKKCNEEIEMIHHSNNKEARKKALMKKIFYTFDICKGALWQFIHLFVRN
jgi:hypothetical protein